MGNIVEISDLEIEFKTRNGTVSAVQDVSFQVKEGETLGIVGESGSGKSVTSYALMRILDRAGVISGGSIQYDGIDIHKAGYWTMRKLRGREMSMVFQNPRAALNPIRKVGLQIEDVLLRHKVVKRGKAYEKVIELLKKVKIKDAEEKYHSYPFELSGGLCQRVVIALALACQPKLLIADEPTTGLDVTTQKAVMDLIQDLTKKEGMSTLLITHDLGLASVYCDRIIVMKSGEVVETGSPEVLFSKPKHPYTRKLMQATPRIGSSVRDLAPQSALGKKVSDQKKTAQGQVVLKVSNLVKEFPRKTRQAGWFGKANGDEQEMFRAVDDVSFEIRKGQSVGLVGESGCGKSTTSSIIMRLLEPTSGIVMLDDVDLTAISVGRFARGPHRSKLQMVFQDPTDSLNPRFTAARAISDPIRMLGSREERREIDQRVEELAEMVGLPVDLLERFPHQLSGGQKARVGIARAIALNPKLLILDEPTAALDVSVQAVVLNLLADLKEQLDMSYLFVSHDLNVVRLLCDDVIVMKDGAIVEKGKAEKIMSSPSEAYTKRLIDAAPQPPAAG